MAERSGCANQHDAHAERCGEIGYVRDSIDRVRVRVWHRVGSNVSSRAWALLGRHVDARVMRRVGVRILESIEK